MNFLTIETANKLTEKLDKIFPNDLLRKKWLTGYQAFEKAVIVVDEMDNYHVQSLYLLAAELELEIKLKRSGTGISIAFTPEHLD